MKNGNATSGRANASAAATDPDHRRTALTGRWAQISAKVAGRNANGTQLTQARCVVSGRCNAWGMRPRPNNPTDRSTRGRHASGSARTRHTPTATVTSTVRINSTNQSTTWCAARA
ncbi:MAG TPA: hypothetical protein VGM93_12790 [Acidimicrobiales bacterium]